MSRFTLLSGMQRAHWLGVGSKAFKGVGLVFLIAIVGISGLAHADKYAQPAPVSYTSGKSFLSSPEVLAQGLTPSCQTMSADPSAVIMTADTDDPKKTRYWLRSPKTHGQWLAVRDLRKYVNGKPDFLAVLKSQGWEIWQRQANGSYQMTRMPAKKGLEAIPGPIPAAITNVVVTESREYTYDANGNLRARFSPSRLDQYSYDALDRIKDDTPSGQATRTHTYDPNGNRTDQGNITYQPNSNRIAMVNGIALSYDAIGNLNTDHRGKIYTYNHAGRLKRITKGGQTLATYVYNFQGLRTEKVTPLGTTRYHYDLQGNLLAETTDTGTPIRSYVWLDGMPVAQIDKTPSGDKVTYLHTDHLNTPRVGTDEKGKVVWRWESDAFGNALPNEDPDGDGTLATVNLRFPGQYYDSESGLYYNWHRYYDPELGRYITSDPIGLRAGLNTYAYVSNNPLSWIDPFGLQGDTLNLGQGFTARMDKFNFKGSASFEIHVFGKQGQEIGVFGPDGWVSKHGKGVPKDIPKQLENSLKGLAVHEMRRMQRFPSKGRANIKGNRWKEIARKTRKGCKVLGPVGIPISAGILWAIDDPITPDELLCDAVWGCSEPE